MQKIKGGTRPGAGRRPKYGKRMSRETVRLDLEKHIARLKEIDPNLSKAIRMILDDPAIWKTIKKHLVNKEIQHAN